MRYVAEAFRTSDVELVSHFTSKPGRAGDRGACPIDVGPPLAPHVSLLVLPLVTPLLSLVAMLIPGLSLRVASCLSLFSLRSEAHGIEASSNFDRGLAGNLQMFLSIKPSPLAGPRTTN